jgi:hypothetical protein
MQLSTPRHARLVALVATALTLIVPGAAQAATYFVDGAAGSDANAGTSQAAPWRSVAKVNAGRFVAGDSVLFRGGVVYSGMLSPHAAGSAAAPVVFGAYGTGRPVLDGSSGSGYAGIEIDYGSAYVVFSGFEVRGYASGHAAYLYSGANVTFDDLYAHDNLNGIWVGGSGPGVPNVTIANSRLFASVPGGGLVVNNSNDRSTGWVYRDSEFANAGDSCILDWPGRSTYLRVNVHHCGYDPSITNGKHGLYLKGSDSVVRDSEFSDVFMGTGGGSCISPRGGAELTGNRLHDCPSGIGWFDYTRAATSRLVVRRNTISRYRDFGLYADTVCSCNGAGTYVAGHRVTFDVANNTFAAGQAGGAASAYGAVFAGAAATFATDVHFDNNIVAGALSGPALQLFNSSPGTYTGTDNAYFTSGGAPKLLLAGRTYGAATLPNERGSLVQDPAFVDGAAATPDLHLASASALRDRGTASPSTGALQSGCAASIDAYCGTAPEPGAFELDATVPPPATPPTTPPPTTTSPPPPGKKKPPTRPRTAPTTTTAQRPARPSHLTLRHRGRSVSARWRAEGARVFRVYVDGRLRRVTHAPRIAHLHLHRGRHRISVVAVAGGLQSSRVTATVRLR